MLLGDLATLLAQTPNLKNILDFDNIVRYITLVKNLRPLITGCWQPVYNEDPPEHLQAHLHDFLKLCFDLEDEDGKWAWSTFRGIAWRGAALSRTASLRELSSYIPLFMRHGLSREIGEYHCQSNHKYTTQTVLLFLGVLTMLPPTQVCIDPRCAMELEAEPGLRNHTLGEEISHPISIFTRDFGPIPGWSQSTYCRSK
jgi:hypothetical protein